LTGNQFQFNALAGAVSINTGGGIRAGTLMGKPVFLQDDVSEMSTGNKVIAVGSPAYYGLVERRGLTVLRDPYSKASSGQVVFHCSFRQGGKVLVAAAWAYGTMA
jgi:HK97 family phage major capsid protein